MSTCIEVFDTNKKLYLSFTDNAKNYIGTSKRHISIGVFAVYIDTGSSVLNIPSKSRGLADEDKKLLKKMEMIRSKRIGFVLC